MSNPLFSIIIPLHNKGKYIADTIRSVIAQEETDWELIIIENGSTDDGPDIAGSFSIDARIRVRRTDRLGPGNARNVGLREASGRWILFLDADDIILPTYLKNQLGTTVCNAEADLIVSKWFVVYGEKKDTLIKEQSFCLDLPASKVVIPAIAIAPWILHAAIVKKEFLHNNHITWDTSLDSHQAEDVVFWFQCLQTANLAWNQNRDAIYNKHLENSRDRVVCANKRLNAINAVVKANITVLHNHHMALNNLQTEIVARAYESCYRLAKHGRDNVCIDTARILADAWFSKCKTNSISIAFRKSLGVSLAFSISDYFKSIRLSKDIS